MSLSSDKKLKTNPELEVKFVKHCTHKKKVDEDDINLMFSKKNKKNDKYNIKPENEFTSEKKMTDPYKNLDKFTQKVGISKDVVYTSTS